MSQSIIGQRFESIINFLIQQKKVDSYTEFAQKMGFKSKSSISSIIAGRANPTPELLNSMAKLYKVSANYILLGTGEMFLQPVSDKTPTETSTPALNHEASDKEQIAALKALKEELEKQLGTGRAFERNELLNDYSDFMGVFEKTPLAMLLFKHHKQLASHEERIGAIEQVILQQPTR